MNRLNILAVVLLVSFVPGCQPAPKQYTELESHILDASNSESILIQVDHGEVIVFEAEDDHVEIGGQVLLADKVDFQVNSTQEQILIKAHVNKASPQDIPLRVEVRVPNGMQVKVETDSASVLASNYQGDLEVDSTSGKITIEQITGRITLWSNRGNISVRKSLGNINVAGNYGALNVQDTHGETAVSTIMGNVVFDGLIQAGDVVRLETDHGPVSVNLDQDSSLSLQANSISGDAACMVPDISSTPRTCVGVIGAGEGILKIRTVSGAITLQSTP